MVNQNTVINASFQQRRAGAILREMRQAEHGRPAQPHSDQQTKERGGYEIVSGERASGEE